MGTVTELNDPFTYIKNKQSGDIEGVQWARDVDYVIFMRDGTVECDPLNEGGCIPKHELKQLMIMWLALEYPDSLNVDKDEEIETLSGTEMETVIENLSNLSSRHPPPRLIPIDD